MNKLKFLLSKTLVYYLWQEFQFRYYFKFTLPKLREIQIDDVRLDVSSLNLKARHRLLKVGYETHEKRLCRDFLCSDDSVLEIGAAIGFIGLYCQKILGIRSYVLVEANPRTLEMLRRNYALNGLTPVAFNLAVGAHDGTVELNVDSDFWENSIVDRGNAAAGRKTMDVPAVTLKTMLQSVRHGFNVLIIDVEGAEQFLDFAEIPASVDKIIVELHPALLGAEKTYDIIANLIGKGFRVAREESNTFVFLRTAPKLTVPNSLPFWNAEPFRNGRSLVNDISRD